MIATLGASGTAFSLRLASLAGKFGLSLYVVAYLSLDDLGLYGLVFSASMVAVVLYGARIDHDLARRIVNMNAHEGHALLRDQTLFFLINYALTLPVLVIVGHYAPQHLSLVLIAFLICCLESYANLVFVMTNYLGKPILANVAFFIRAGLWSLLVVAIGLALPSTRTLWFVLGFWVAGTSASIALNLLFLDVVRWPALKVLAVDWTRICAALRRSFPIWIGSIALAGGLYLDRFILGAFLDLSAVGLATFYTSFTTAIVTLVSSSVLNVAAPKLVGSASRSDGGAFNRELWRAGLTVVALGVALCLLVWISVHQFAALLDLREIKESMLALGLLMIATLVRLVAEAALYALYARHSDKDIWVGNIGFFLASLLLNLLLVPSFGLNGLGIASVLASLFLVILRRDGLRALGSRGAG